MTTDLYAYTPAPDRAWQIAVDGGLRLNEPTKVNALIHAAIETEASFQFIADRENWLIIRRLMHETVRGDDFGSLVTAVADGDPARMRQVAERLVYRS